MINLKKAESTAMQLARKSGDLLLKNIGKVKITKIKGTEDYCTNVDIKSENLIIKGIKNNYPDHSILSEEIGEINKNSDYRWIIDPIDGTRNFIKNFPIFTICIALEYKGEMVLGVVYDPSSDRMYNARKGKGAFLNNNRIHVSKTSQLDHAYIYVDNIGYHELPKNQANLVLKRLNRLATQAHRVRALGAGSLGMCYLAQGAYDAYIDITGKTKYVDIAAGSIIVKEAGGYVKDIERKRTIAKETYHFASNLKLKKRIQSLLQI